MRIRGVRYLAITLATVASVGLCMTPARATDYSAAYSQNGTFTGAYGVIPAVNISAVPNDAHSHVNSTLWMSTATATFIESGYWNGAAQDGYYHPYALYWAENNVSAGFFWYNWGDFYPDNAGRVFAYAHMAPGYWCVYFGYNCVQLATHQLDTAFNSSAGGEFQAVVAPPILVSTFMINSLAVYNNGWISWNGTGNAPINTKPCNINGNYPPYCLNGSSPGGPSTWYWNKGT